MLYVGFGSMISYLYFALCAIACFAIYSWRLLLQLDCMYVRALQQCGFGLGVGTVLRYCEI